MFLIISRLRFKFDWILCLFFHRISKEGGIELISNHQFFSEHSQIILIWFGVVQAFSLVIGIIEWIFLLFCNQIHSFFLRTPLFNYPQIHILICPFSALSLPPLNIDNFWAFVGWDSFLILHILLLNLYLIFLFFFLRQLNFLWIILNIDLKQFFLVCFLENLLVSHVVRYKLNEFAHLLNQGLHFFNEVFFVVALHQPMEDS